jgi:Na+/H+-translocating membrane pyrophosphatase
MKKYKQLLDIILLVGLATMALLAVAPKTFVMPSSLQMLLLACVLGLVATFLVVFWREQPEDEREMQNQALASRTAYTVGSLVLIIALFIQSMQHNLDPAIPIALLAMIATKIIVQRTKDDK